MSVVNDVYKIAKYILGDFRAFKFREFSSEIIFFFSTSVQFLLISFLSSFFNKQTPFNTFSELDFIFFSGRHLSNHQIVQAQ